MVDVSIVNETSPEANWNRRADRQASRQAGGRIGKKDESSKNRVFYIIYVKIGLHVTVPLRLKTGPSPKTFMLIAGRVEGLDLLKE